MKSSHKWLSKANLILATWISSLLLILAASFYLVRHSHLDKVGNSQELFTLLFSVSSLALFIFSILMAVLGLVGWKSILDAVRTVAKETSEKVHEPLKNELQGRAQTGLGYMLGQMSLDPKTLQPIDREQLADAIQLCDDGYALLQKVGGAKAMLGLNNLIYYLSFSDDTTRAEFLLNGARELMAAGQAHNVANLKLTACRVMLQHGTAEERKRSCEILESLTKGAPSPRERREATIHYETFCKGMGSDKTNPPKPQNEPS